MQSDEKSSFGPFWPGEPKIDKIITETEISLADNFIYAF